MDWYSAARGGWTGAALVGVALLAVGCQDGTYVQTEQYVTRGDQPEERVGSGCMSTEKGSGMGGGLAPGVPGAAGEGSGPSTPSYSFSYEGTGGGLHFELLDGDDATLSERTYDAAFLASGRKDEVSVTLEDQTLRFVAWGVADCRSGSSL